MITNYEIQILRSKLIAMTRLAQRTVDYSIKAMQLGTPELCRVVHNSREEMKSIRCWIASHGPVLLAADISNDADTRFVCAAMRISGALEAAYNAAIEIAQHSETRFAAGWIPVSAELEDAGQFVNSLLRLCVLSLLRRDAWHAKEVLQNSGAGENLDLAVHLTHRHRMPRTGAQARFELAIIRSLDGIAGQTREIADAIIHWLEEAGPQEAASEGAAHKSSSHTATFTSGACAVPPPDTDSLCGALGVWSAIAARKTLHLNSPVDLRIQSRGNAEPAPSEDSAQARLMGLQQRVCELLVKNQQLRMALMAERADSQPDRLC